jgi:hypothetical protein
MQNFATLTSLRSFPSVVESMLVLRTRPRQATFPYELFYGHMDPGRVHTTKVKVVVVVVEEEGMAKYCESCSDMQQLSCVVVESAATANIVLNSGISFTKTNAYVSEIQGKVRLFFTEHTSCMCVTKLWRCPVSDSATSTTTTTTTAAAAATTITNATTTIPNRCSDNDLPSGFQTIYLTSALLTITPGDYPADATNQVTKSFFSF